MLKLKICSEKYLIHRRKKTLLAASVEAMDSKVEQQKSQTINVIGILERPDDINKISMRGGSEAKKQHSCSRNGTM